MDRKTKQRGEAADLLSVFAYPDEGEAAIKQNARGGWIKHRLHICVTSVWVIKLRASLTTTRLRSWLKSMAILAVSVDY